MGAFRYRQQQTGLVYDLLPPEVQPTARPRQRFDRAPDISDADFVTVLPTRPKVSPARSFNDNRRHRQQNAQPSPSGAVATLCADVAERWLQRASRRTFALLVAALVLLVFGLSGGLSGLSSPPTVAVSTVAALGFERVTLTPKDANGMKMLVVSGIIENRTNAAVAVPEIRADLMAGDRVLSSNVVTPPTGRLDAGASRGFSARLQHPGGNMPQVRLSFLP